MVNGDDLEIRPKCTHVKHERVNHAIPVLCTLNGNATASKAAKINFLVFFSVLLSSINTGKSTYNLHSLKQAQYEHSVDLSTDLTPDYHRKILLVAGFDTLVFLP